MPDPFFNDPDGSRNDMGAIFFDGAVGPLPDTVFVPDDFADLQQAIAGVNGGGTILVRCGHLLRAICHLWKVHRDNVN